MGGRGAVRAVVVAVVAGVLTAGCAATTAPCNGHAALCDRPLDQVTLPATHNAMSNGDEGWLAPNQQHPPRQQLEDGIRGMLLDTYLVDGVPTLCHSYCDFGSTPLADVLGELRDFLDAHPRELVTLVFQDALSVDDTVSALDDAGLADRLVTAPDAGEAWPTLGALLDDGQQLLTTRESSGDGPATYRPFYDLGFDTPYSFASVDDFSCDLLRGSADHPLFLLNHWLSTPLPTRDGAADANRADVLARRIADCTAAFGRGPSLVAVDHYDVGDLFEVVDAVNGVADDAP